MPPPDNWLKNLLNVTIEANQPLWKNPKQHFAGRDIGAPCSRALTFKLAGHNVPYKAKTLRIFAVGNKIEDGNVEVLERTGTLIATQEEVLWDDPPIRGKIDVRVSHDDEFKLIGDVKSINHRAFEKLPKEHGPILAGQSTLMAKKPGYVHQLNGYLVMGKYDIGFLLFENKDDGEQLCYWILPDTSLFDSGLAQLRVAHGYSRVTPQKIAPIPTGRNPFKGDAICSDCSVRYLCKLVPKEGSTIGRAKEIDKGIRG